MKLWFHSAPLQTIEKFSDIRREQKKIKNNKIVINNNLRENTKDIELL